MWSRSLKTLIKAFFTSETREAEYTTVNIVKSQNMDKSFLTFPTKAAKYTTVYADNVVVNFPNSDKRFLTSPTKAAKQITVAVLT